MYSDKTDESQFIDKFFFYGQDEEHSGKVNCVCWDPSDQTLVSCSEDQYIVHWDVSSYKAIWCVN